MTTDIKPSDMGTTGLLYWVMDASNTRGRGQRKRRALDIMEQRYGVVVRDVFKRALATMDRNRAFKEWALL